MHACLLARLLNPFPPFFLSSLLSLCCRETEENWEAEIADDVGGECSKYGPVQHVYVDKNSRGFVYVVSGSGGWQRGQMSEGPLLRSDVQCWP